MTRMLALAALLAAIAGLASGCSGARDVRSPPPDVSSIAAPADPARPMPRSAPLRVQIPALGVDSDLMALGLATDGTMEVPPAASPAGWFTGAPAPGEVGPAIIVGHVDWRGRRGVFFDLHKAKRGDRITVVRQDHSTAVFQVNRVGEFAKDEFPTELVYGNTPHAALRLITCGGTLDRSRHSYRDNVIVFAELVQSVLARA